MNRTAVVPVALSALLLAAASSALLAQGDPGGAKSQAPQITFRAGVEVVTVTASVRDRGGRVVRDLKQSDFEVIDSGMPRPRSWRRLRPEPAPTT